MMINVVLAGIGGYGEGYLNALLNDADTHNARLAGCVDPFAAASKHIDVIRQRNIPVYDSLEEFYKNHSAELAVISSPIHYHKSQTITALQAGSNVLCEKPVAALVEDALAMADAAKKAKRFVAIGYQWSFSPANIELKEDILAGHYGKPKRFKTCTCWPRWESYYKRNNWAGRIKTDNGLWILDSPANNATAHYLNNMFFVAGTAINKSAEPEKIEAELYRAKSCENYDTAAVRMMTDTGVELLFLTTHSSKETIGPVLEFEFEHGKVTFSPGDFKLVGQLSHGDKKVYGNPYDDEMHKLWECVDAARDSKVIPCDIYTALPHLICINQVQKMPIHVMPQSMVKTICKDNNTLVYIEGIEECFNKCFETYSLPSEVNPDYKALINSR